MNKIIYISAAVVVVGLVYFTLNNKEMLVEREMTSRSVAPNESGESFSQINKKSKKSAINNHLLQDELPLAPSSDAIPERLVLWHPSQTRIDVDGIKGYEIITPSNQFRKLKVDQILDISLPDTDVSVQAKLASTHNQGANIHVWKGKILNGAEHDNITVVRGKVETHITIATEKETYIAIIDNASGQGSIVNQSDINAGQIPFDDAIELPPIDAEPPILSDRS